MLVSRVPGCSIARYATSVSAVLSILCRQLPCRSGLFLNSWGTQLGILAVQRYPEDYHAFISVAQLVHPQQFDIISYEWLKKQVEEYGSQRQIREFEQLAPPLYDERERYVTFAKMKDFFGGSMDVSMGRLAWIAFGAKEYAIGDYVTWLRGANRGSGPCGKNHGI